MKNACNRNEQYRPSRRSFLKIAGGMGVALLGLGTAGRCLANEDFLRPPGGQSAENFFARCIRCDRCRSVCPTQVIGLANVRQGLLNARTPIMEFHHGYCDFCHACIDVCPTGALQAFDEKREKIGVAEIEKEVCLAWDSRGCRLCVDACPYGAISLEGAHPVVNREKCNGCGVCENVCPALVLHGFRGSRTRGIRVNVISEDGDGQ